MTRSTDFARHFVNQIPRHIEPNASALGAAEHLIQAAQWDAPPGPRAWYPQKLKTGFRAGRPRPGLFRAGGPSSETESLTQVLSDFARSFRDWRIPWVGTVNRAEEKSTQPPPTSRSAPRIAAPANRHFEISRSLPSRPMRNALFSFLMVSARAARPVPLRHHTSCLVGYPDADASKSRKSKGTRTGLRHINAATFNIRPTI
jgi:hypothetical protein